MCHFGDLWLPIELDVHFDTRVLSWFQQVQVQSTPFIQGQDLVTIQEHTQYIKDFCFNQEHTSLLWKMRIRHTCRYFCGWKKLYCYELH